MKKCAIFFLFFLLVSSAICQDNITSMFVDGRSWRYEHLKPDWQSTTEYQDLNDESNGYISTNYVLKVEGDAQFDGHQCKKIICDGLDGISLYAYGYEEGEKVMLYAFFNEPAFYAPFPTEQWVTLYDFSTPKDSHCQMGAFWCNDMIVSGEGMIYVDGTACRYIGLSDAKIPAWPVRYAVQGVGSSFGLYEFENTISDGSSSRFIGCYDDETCLFSADDFKSLTTGICIVETTIDYHDVYSPSGRHLSTPSKGLNIIRDKDGHIKKVIM